MDWDNIRRLPRDPALAPPPKAPLSMVTIRNLTDDGCDSPPMVFPPSNHENLLISPGQPPTPNKIPRLHTDNRRISFTESDSDSDSNSSSTFSPSDTSPVPRSPLFPPRIATKAADAAGWFDSWVEILHSKVSGLARSLCSGFISSRGVFVSFRSAAFMVVLVASMYFRRRRSLRAAEGSRVRLIGIIQERDEKINQLLDQLSQLNQMLLALHRVPTAPTP